MVVLSTPYNSGGVLLQIAGWPPLFEDQLVVCSLDNGMHAAGSQERQGNALPPTLQLVVLIYSISLSWKYLRILLL
jgi:hypothetical protein